MKANQRLRSLNPNKTRKTDANSAKLHPRQNRQSLIKELCLLFRPCSRGKGPVHFGLSIFESAGGSRSWSKSPTRPDAPVCMLIQEARSLAGQNSDGRRAKIAFPNPLSRPCVCWFRADGMQNQQNDLLGIPKRL